MAGRPSGSDRTRSYKTTTASTGRSSTRRFSTVSPSASRAQLAREKQRRQYEQQKREKLIFALFVVIILVMILFAILIFKKIVGDAPSDTRDTGSVTDTTPPPDTDPVTPAAFKDEMVARDRVYQGALILVTEGSPRKVTPALTDLSAVEGKAYQMSGLGTYMETAAANAFIKMAADEYSATGTKMLVHRCYEADQSADELGSGLAVDLAVYDGSSTHALSSAACTEVLGWLKANASDYGFVILTPEQTGKTHYGFRYVGVPHASYMEENGLSLAAYLEQLRNYSANEPMSIVVDGANYAIYYVPEAGGDMTAVPILKDAVSFEISGDNAGGFIVTARMN